MTLYCMMHRIIIQMMHLYVHDYDYDHDPYNTHAIMIPPYTFVKSVVGSLP
jgi:hypothetical protein